MQVQEMFKNDINREINPVVKVETEILRQELDEYVITKELKSIFVDFFNYYAKTFSEDVQNIGVWISGGFGSGKSHFLKILSYLLENKKIDEIRTVERFRSKFEDPGTFMQIEQAIKGETETILFNINKYKSEKKTALTLAFAKIFYKHCGYCGDIKISKLEQSIDELGKMDEFQQIFKEKSGKNWKDSRSKAFLTFSKPMEETLQAIFGTDKNVIRDWKKDADIFDIDTLVHDIKKYVDKQSPNYRLLFMADEVGQYVGADSDRLLDLQTLVEEIGTQCRGKVWIICTGQEALDKVIKTRQDEFSKIQDRFIKLPLNSTSIDEVIQKRLLDKTPEANEFLNKLYEKNELTIRNLLKFNKDDAVSDIRGFNNAIDFSKNFPFIPYQFILMQKVLKKITEHGSSGRNTSTGERSILSAFHKVAQKIKKHDEYALAPFYPFYDTIHNILDETIRQVINRCENAAENDAEIKPQDVNVLKLLYLIRYLDDDVKATVDSIVILMANDIRTDKISLRNQVEVSLDRLLKQNYIGRTGNTYHFLTNEEQDIARDIKNTSVNMQKLSEEIGKTIFGEIFTDKKFRYKDRSRFQDFQISKFIDEIQLESIAGGMELHIYSVATNESSKEELRLLTDSNKKAIVVLDNDKYYENYMNALRIHQYAETKNVAQLPKSTQDIISKQRENEGQYKEEGRKELEEAIINGKFYVDGENITEELSKSITAKNKIYQVLEKLFQRIYNRFDYVKEHYETSQDISDILNGKNKAIDGLNPNEEAIDEVKDFISRKAKQNLRISMEEIQGEYRKAPYGWAEVDIAALIAILISNQKVIVKYSGKPISPEDPKLPDMLMKKSERGKTIISERQSLNPAKLNKVISFLRDYLPEMNVPKDEDGLIKFIAEKFEWLKRDYEQLNDKYKGKKYPDKEVVEDAIKIVDEVLSQQNEPVALIDKLITLEGDLHDVKESLEKVESFFKNKMGIFDKAVAYTKLIQTDIDYINKYQGAVQALNEIKKIIQIVPGQEFAYKRIPELHDLIETIKLVHDELLQQNRQKILGIAQSCMKAIHEKAVQDSVAKKISDESDYYFDQKKKALNVCETISALKILESQMWEKRDEVLQKINEAVSPKSPESVKKTYKKIARQEIFPAKTLQSEAEIDEYVESIREEMKRYLKENNGFEIN